MRRILGSVLACAVLTCLSTQLVWAIDFLTPSALTQFSAEEKTEVVAMAAFLRDNAPDLYAYLCANGTIGTADNKGIIVPLNAAAKFVIVPAPGSWWPVKLDHDGQRWIIRVNVSDRINTDLARNIGLLHILCRLRAGDYLPEAYSDEWLALSAAWRETRMEALNKTTNGRWGQLITELSFDQAGCGLNRPHATWDDDIAQALGLDEDCPYWDVGLFAWMAAQDLIHERIRLSNCSHPEWWEKDADIRFFRALPPEYNGLL
ncbi:MAG: hypothetical protein WC497_04685 [Patescibacteria group bacterium]